MRPECFRKIINLPGTSVGLIGDYDGPSEWSAGKLIVGTVQTYVVVERPHNMAAPNGELVWDAAALISLPSPLTLFGRDEQEYFGDLLLLIHRYPEAAWDNQDPNVHVFGIKQNETLLGNEPLPLGLWRPKTIWLSSAAIMTVEDAENLSEMARVLRTKK